ncbi:O-methyltransferase [Sparassis latifolia]
MDFVEMESLVSLISTSIAQLKDRANTASSPENATRAEFLRPSLQIVAAASQLIALVRTPERYLMDVANGHVLSECLRTTVDVNVPEIIREFGKGPQRTLHVTEIGAVNHVNPSKLGRVLRLLSTHHIFEEVSPNVFANNHISIALDTGKSLSELEAQPAEKYDGTNGVAAIVGLLTDDALQNATYLSDTLRDPATTDSFDAYDAPFSRAWAKGAHLNMFEWLNLPDNVSRRKRYQMAMNGLNKMTPPDSILRGFDWTSLPEGSIVIDCGGGIGSASLPVIKACRQVRVIIQDTEKVIVEAPEFWRTVLPSAVAEGSVSFQAHNLFYPQPPNNSEAAVFLLRMILHGWPDTECIQILNHIRDCIGENMEARVLIVDNIMLYASRDAATVEPDLLAPEPLLANWGTANLHSYTQDVLMLCNHNACERTLPEFAALLAQCRFEILEVHQAHQSWLPQIVAAPI